MSAFACFLCTPVSLPYLHFYKLCTPLALRKLADRQPNLSTPAATTISLNILIKLSGYELYKWDTEAWISWIFNTAHSHGRVVETLDTAQVGVETSVRIFIFSDRVADLGTAGFQYKDICRQDGRDSRSSHVCVNIRSHFYSTSSSMPQLPKGRCGSQAIRCSIFQRSLGVCNALKRAYRIKGGRKTIDTL
jgi:hypothetical protein